RSRDCRLHVSLRSYIGFREARGRAELCCERFSARFVAVEDHDFGAACDEAPNRRFAQTRSSTSHHCYPTFHLHDSLLCEAGTPITPTPGDRQRARASCRRGLAEANSIPTLLTSAAFVGNLLLRSRALVLLTAPLSLRVRR